MKLYPGIICMSILLVIASSCKKTNTSYNPIDTLPTGDARSILLKDVVIDKLPSPYFHFTYDNSKLVTGINFADGLLKYRLVYENKRIKTMTNPANGNILQYLYANGQVSAIKKISGTTGKTLWHYGFTYYANGYLKEIRWYVFENGSGDSVLDRKVVLIYNADGNLAEFDELRNNGHNELIWTRTVEFQNYDKGTNVDDFYLLKDFFEDVLFLPQVKLQKNNPAFSKVTGTEKDYEITYTYQYNNKQLPVRKTMDMLQTRGAGSGQHEIFTEEFSYY